MTTTMNRTTLHFCCVCRQKHEYCYWYEPLKGYLCPYCRLTPQPYDTANMTSLGLPLKHLPPFSLEFEVTSLDDHPASEALILLKYQYKRTSDGTVDDEYKSPIYSHLAAFRKPLAVLHNLRHLVTDYCGTHLHIGCRQKERLREIHAEVFSPLLDHMLTHPEQTVRFWGRFFTQYATAPNVDRYHCFNLESCHSTLEFRLPRFRSAEQYRRLLQFCRRSVAYLDTALAISGEGYQTTEEGTQMTIEQQAVMQTPDPGVIGKHVLALYKRAVNTLPEREEWVDEQLSRIGTLFPTIEERDQDDDWDDDF